MNFFFIIIISKAFNILGNKSESKDGSKEEIQAPISVGFENSGAIPKTKSVKDSKIYLIYLIIIK